MEQLSEVEGGCTYLSVGQTNGCHQHVSEGLKILDRSHLPVHESDVAHGGVTSQHRLHWGWMVYLGVSPTLPCLENTRSTRSINQDTDAGRQGWLIWSIFEGLQACSSNGANGRQSKQSRPGDCRADAVREDRTTTKNKDWDKTSGDLQSGQDEWDKDQRSETMATRKLDKLGGCCHQGQKLDWYVEDPSN